MSEVTFSKPATYNKVRTIRAELPRTTASGEWAPPQEVAILRCRTTAGPVGWSVWTPDTYERGGASRLGICLAADLTLAEARKLGRIAGRLWCEGQSAVDLGKAIAADPAFAPIREAWRQRQKKVTRAAP